MTTQHFIIEGRYLGQATRGLLLVSGGAIIPPSYAFFCGRCAELWARCPVDEVPGQPRCEWQVWRRPCRKCPPHSGEVPGSLILPWDSDFNHALPDDVVRWEFERHLEWAERKQL